MKLELKHLAPYLPYGLKFLEVRKGSFNNSDDIIEQVELNTSNINYLNNSRIYKVKSRKIILRPLSDLIKEIEVNGEKFIPILKIAKLHLSDFRSMNPYSTNYCHACTNGSLHRFGYNTSRKSFFLYFDGEEDGFCGLSNQI